MAETGEQLLLRARVDTELREFARRETDRLVAIDADLLPVAEQLDVAVTGGKRLRASFCYWGWRAAGQPDSDALVRAAAAMELVHAAAVVHDDLIDESPTRHGVPSAHVALRTAFAGRARPHAGSRALALLTGDLLMSWAAELFLCCGLPSAYLSRARELWLVMARELIAGECLEVLRTGSPPDTGRSLQVIRYKTAKYTVEHPLRIGGALAGAPGSMMEAFTAYGLPLGEAFQLRDDLLGLFGDPERTGKSNLDDVRGNRPTVLLAETWAAAAPAERRELRGLLGRRGLDGEGLSRVRSIMRRTGAPERVEEMIDQRVRAATSALARADLPGEAAAALSQMVASASDRRS
ncbi:polyprenyl synthetase family protein [Nocardiopsis deserti]|uniref:polyprenyl synthetase family protein n=1 Tax=Nocardiopsis deserti TaxID=2605988 RepID=UPI0012397A64|nr:polyprenyl synthetase family protein [Nocardiopsis deserti]